jgi:hypothetical protein
MDSPRRATLVASILGILGVLVLAIYFSQPLPLPPLNTSLQQLTGFATRYHNAIFIGAWIQGAGTLLVSIFFLDLVARSGAANRLAGLLTVLSTGALWIVGLIEVGESMAVPQSVAVGHPVEASAAFDLTNTFIHLIPIGPAGAVYLSIGALLLGTRSLPAPFAYAALAIGAAFEIVGFIGLFDPNNQQNTITIILIVQELWVLAAAITSLVGVLGRRAPATRSHADTD